MKDSSCVFGTLSFSLFKFAIGSIAAFSYENQPGSANRSIAEIE